jgi:hypothetical protein
MRLTKGCAGVIPVSGACSTALLAELVIRDIRAKAVSRQQATILGSIGAHHVVLPEQDMGQRVAHLVVGRLLDWVVLDPQWVFAKSKPPRSSSACRWASPASARSTRSPWSR